MIVSFRHKGLRRLYQEGDRRKLPAEWADKIERILARLDVAAEAKHMDLPGFRLHALKGDRAGQWAVLVSANWRIVFRRAGGNAHNVDFDVDFIDYH